MEDYIRRKKLILSLMAEPTYVPMKIKEIAIIMQAGKEDRPMLERILEDLIEEGKIEISKRGKYSLATEKEYTGRFVSHQSGFGFVEVEGRDEDLFIPEDYVFGALHGDTVKVKLIPGKKGKRQEAKIISVIERANTSFVGTYEKSGKGYGFVVPDNLRITKDVFVPVEKSMNAKDGMKVVVTVDKYSDSRNPEGTITEILGMEGDPGVDILSIIKAYDLPLDFPGKVQSQAENVAKPVSLDDENGRCDLTSVLMVTIDGEDAKDLDDAVSLTVNDGIYELGVHIADVTNYVQENSALDREALKRATSVYLADRVIPMLPKELSNGCCSLNQKEKRLALSCIMQINEKGKIISSEVKESVICVDRRMSYTEVNAILSGTASSELLDECDYLIPMFKDMEVLASLLRKRRFKNGSIDFDLPETKVILNENGEPVAIKPYDRNVATKMIEDFMLAANRTVAETYYWSETPFVYRVHEKPDPDKMRELTHFISNFGYSIKKSEEVHPKELQKLIEKVSGTNEEALISRLTLRSMKKAKYDVSNLGHFGLAFDYYCHFTSPIRRYPDLQIHRIIKDCLRGRMNNEKSEHYTEILPAVAKKSSEREIIAAEAERETIKLKKVEYMSNYIGEEYDGVISGVTSWGLYVELDNTVEGLVHIGSIKGDYYKYSEREYMIYGETTGLMYTLGQKVRIRVESVNKASRTIDFSLAQ